MNQSMNWNMESIFSGGSKSKEARKKLDHHKKQIEAFDKEVHAFDPQNNDEEFFEFKDLLEIYVDIVKGLEEISTFATGLASADVEDTK